jgi:NADPH-dependent 2,4-dienoyl-CoA reductase/sulfur reductase-like enzyme
MTRMNVGFARSLILLGLSVATSFPLGAPDYDLVVYGGTAGGVMTAVSAARQGLSVALVEPGAHIGGMVTGGLSATDHGRKSVVGGMAREFYTRAGQYYGQPINWFPEPKIAGRVLRDMLDETRVRVFLRHRLKDRGGVLREGGKIRSIATEDGAEFRGAVFADATYEGDLMAQSGVSYTLGRESTRDTVSPWQE